jgi:hypothetical protein
VCRHGQPLEFVAVRFARRSPRRHTANFIRPACHTLRKLRYSLETSGAIRSGRLFFVGCDQRSESNGWCAGAGNRWGLLPSGLLVDLRAGTPRISFGPLVTPYIPNCLRRQHQAAFFVRASKVERTQTAPFGRPRAFGDEQSTFRDSNDAE